MNPFNNDNNQVRTIMFSIESILFELGLGNDRADKEKFQLQGIDVKLCNMNPFVYTEGNAKFHYQRGYVWTLKDKQNLLTSLYNGNSLGQVLCRKREYDELELLAKQGEVELSYRDIIDGKQRLTAIAEFYNNVYPDEFGNYYKDFDTRAKMSFKSSQLLKFCETYDSVSDEFVLRQFLRTNFAGVPQDMKHLNLITEKLGEVK